MAEFARYAIYYTPSAGALAAFAASWLGWDSAAGVAVAHPRDLPGLPQERIAALTEVPRRYGFHATLKPPFALAQGSDTAALIDNLTTLAATLSPVSLTQGLAIARLDRFLGLVPAGGDTALEQLAGALVAGLDHHRAPMTPQDRDRRRPDRLTDRQRELLDRWGYPWVMEEFRFHMTLTGDLPPADAEAVLDLLRPVLDPMLPRPFVIDAVTLSGQDAQGRFVDIARVPLTG